MNQMPVPGNEEDNTALATVSASFESSFPSAKIVPRKNACKSRKSTAGSDRKHSKKRGPSQKSDHNQRRDLERLISYPLSTTPPLFPVNSGPRTSSGVTCPENEEEMELIQEERSLTWTYSQDTRPVEEEELSPMERFLREGAAERYSIFGTKALKEKSSSDTSSQRLGKDEAPVETGIWRYSSSTK